LSQAMVRSTTQRLSKIENPSAVSVAFDNFNVDLPADTAQPLPELRPLIAAIGVEFQQEWEHTEQHAHQQHAAVAILDVGHMHDGGQQQTLRVDQDMALLAAEFLSRSVALRIDIAPPFSALLTLWLSMTAAVGLASLSASSRHLT
jgi:hypothetical protein